MPQLFDIQYSKLRPYCNISSVANARDADRDHALIAKCSSIDKYSLVAHAFCFKHPLIGFIFIGAQSRDVVVRVRT